MNSTDTVASQSLITSQNIVLTKLLESCKKILNEHDRKLEEFAHQNSHKLRGPVARIQGLIHLLNLSTAENELPKILEYLRNAAIELDTVTREINKTLECDDLHEDCFKKVLS